MKRRHWTLEELNKLPRTKEEAIIVGSKYYYSGKSCEKGHVAATETNKNRCVECRREYGKLYTERSRRRLGMKKQELLMPLQPGLRINNLILTGGFERRHIKRKKRTYTQVYHEVKCDCGKVFWIRKGQWGKQTQCRKCANQEKLKLAHKIRQETAFISNHRSTTIEAHLLYAARNRALRSGIAFELTIADIKIPEYCPILGFKLDTSLTGARNRAPRFNAPSLDRINTNLGYTKDNVKVVSYRANNLKKDGTAAEHLKVAEFMERMGVIK